MRSVDVFFYGLFMDADALRARGLHPANARLAFVRHFELRIGRRAAMAPKTGTDVHGVVMSLTHREIETLYTDASVRDYKPEAVLAELAGGARCAALCFNLPAPPAAEEVNAEYAERLRDLGRRLKLPSDYVETIR